MRSLPAGLISGLVATVPMTLVMKTLHAQLPRRERYDLPPKRITERATRAVGIEDEARREEWGPLTYLGHFGYGAATAGVYGLLRRAMPGPPVLKGPLFGVLLWAVSYLGWLPAAGLHPPATREPTRRNALMIVAHVVWGVVVGVLTDALLRQLRRRRR